MSSTKLWKTKFSKISKFFLAGALFLALPVSAAITHQRMPSEASILSPVSISVPAIPDDLVTYESGAIGIPRQIMDDMNYWGIAVYTETENFVSECVSMASSLPTAVLNLGIGDYKTAISLGKTKEDCEAFSTAEYPLFAVLETANFNIK